MCGKSLDSRGALNQVRGFSLVELLITVAIILVIASIAVPHLLTAKMAANQSAAVSTLRTISSAEQTFSSTYSDGFTLTIAQLGGPVAAVAGCANARLIDEVLSANPSQRSGYQFQYTANGVAALTSAIPASCGASGDTGFSASATPVTVGLTGTASYCIDETGAIRVNTVGAPIPAPCSTSGFPPMQ